MEKKIVIESDKDLKEIEKYKNCGYEIIESGFNFVILDYKQLTKKK